MMVQPEMGKSTSTTALAHKGPAAVSKLKRRRPQVQVVTCAAAFPISNKPKRKEEAKWPPSNDAKSNERRDGSDKLLDWHDTVKQVRHLGLTGMVGVQKRNHLDEQYKQLTGRDKKKHQVPLPIVRGIKKKAAARQARLRQEAKEAGIVLPTAKTATLPGTTSSHDRKKDSTNRIHGPAPSIGFMKKGVFRLPSNQKR
jgi:Domain of unknown function (DUF4602)